DKAEDILAEYFKKYGHFHLSGGETEKLELSLLLKELGNVKDLYESHRLYVYYSCVDIFHRLFVETEDNMEDDDIEPIEDIFDNVQEIFDSYQLDSIYYHLNLVFEYLKLEYYNHYGLFRKAEKFYEEVNDAVDNLLSNYTLYTYPSRFLITKMERHLRLGKEAEIYEEADASFQDFELDKDNLPAIVTYHVYRGYACYYVNDIQGAIKWFNSLLNESELKKYTAVLMEVKVLLALQYALSNEHNLFNQLINSVQRHIRNVGRENCEHIYYLSKILKISMSEMKKNKEDKIYDLLEAFPNVSPDHFAPTMLLKKDEQLVEKLCTQKQEA
ncbi:MAG: hypothetical protein R3345_09145, partial [Fulvivirga sp.]|nr:hypothetical protein [Fulvivirga sp.]